MSITKDIVRLSEEGKTVKEIRGWLVFQHSIEGKDATAEIAKAGVGGSVSTGFAADFYAELREDTMTVERFEAIIAEGSKNVQNHKSHYNAIRELANSIWAQA